MRRLGAALLAGAVVGLLAHAAPVRPAAAPQPDVLRLLAAFDEAPDPEALRTALGPGAGTALADLAGDAAADPGVRLRATRALADFPAPEVHAALVAQLEALRDTAGGYAAVLLRATLEALGEVGSADDVARITPLLQHPLRDLRAAAALALRAIGSTLALDALFEQQAVETSPQVRTAIQEALRALLSGPGA